MERFNPATSWALGAAEARRAIDEGSLTSATLFLRVVFGATYEGSRPVVGNTVGFDPHADLPGSRQFSLNLTALVADRAGNPFGATSVRLLPHI